MSAMTHKPLFSSHTPNILIIRPSAMGDIIMATPMIHALRRAYPQARLSWLVEPGLADLLRENRELDEVIVWPKGDWVRLARARRYLALWRAVRAFRAELRYRNFTLAIDAVGLAKSRVLLWLSGASQRIGFDSKEPGGFLLTRRVVKNNGDRRMSSEYRQMVETLGAEPGRFLPNVPLAPDSVEQARQLLLQYGVNGRYVVLAPFTTRPQKHWFDECWTALAEVLFRRFGLTAVILGGSGDREHGAAIADSSPSVINLAGQTPLGVSCAVVQGAALMVGVDTGLTHLGTAYERPTIALFGATRPYLETPSSLTRVLYRPRACSPCRRQPTCHGRFDCMHDHTPEDVAAAAAALLDRGVEAA